MTDSTHSQSTVSFADLPAQTPAQGVLPFAPDTLPILP